MKQYAAGFTGAGLFRQEIREVLRLQGEGLSHKELLEYLIVHNSFHLQSESGIKERLQKVNQRIKTFDQVLSSNYLNGTRYDENALILYSYLVTYRFPYEFFIECVLYNYQDDKNVIRVSDLDYFFERKESESDEVKYWTPQTKKRMRQSITMFFRECGLFAENGNGEYQLNPLHINSELRQYAEGKYPLLYKMTILR
ncbi:DUF1819 family protein [Paenibacillus herberti]|uniref:DUF1819 domain-containing protein n=1 Tax=Paenibacillus herberti TaxID=1619309 RepID=A0A229NUA1_9BACL|nr:DUF1819 family protein [Paenibacillus herberti]OXM13285.1 hypothetical protein CGZ75_19630 [Paenibacillus herberti]